jgi:hypothetical protein
MLCLGQHKQALNARGERVAGERDLAIGEVKGLGRHGFRGHSLVSVEALRLDVARLPDDSKIFVLKHHTDGRHSSHADDTPAGSMSRVQQGQSAGSGGVGR